MASSSVFEHAAVFARRAVRIVTTTVLVVGGWAVACTDLPVQPETKPPLSVGRVAVFANTVGSGVTSIVIEVSGPGIVKADLSTPDTLMFNLDVVDGSASGSLDVPAGSARTFTVRAFTNAQETHRGGVTTDITTGVNPTIAITLFPLTGTVPITVTIGTTLVMVQPDSVFVNLGDTLRMSAQVRDQANNVVATRVVWATTDGSRATIDTTGLLTMRDTGKVQVVASAAGSAGLARVFGKRFPATTTSYQLTWNGSRSRNWSDSLNWTALNHGAPRVPAASDSVVIPSGTPNQPQIACSSVVSARDLVIEATATLTSSCGASGTIRIFRSAKIDGTISFDAEWHAGTIAGTLGKVVFAGDTVRLGGNTTLTSLEGRGAFAVLVLGGHHLQVNGSATLNGGSRIVPDSSRIDITGGLTLNDSSGVEMDRPGDTISVRGALTVQGVRSAPLAMSAGVAMLGGNVTINGAFGWSPSAAHLTILDGGADQHLSADSGTFVGGSWPNMRIRNKSTVHIYPRTRDNGTLSLPAFRVDSAGLTVLHAEPQNDCACASRRYAITPLGGTLTVNRELQVTTNAVLTVNGNLTLPAAAPLDTPKVTGGGSVGTNNGTLRMGAGSVLSAAFIMRGDNQLVVESGTQVIAGNVTLSDSSAIVMQDAGDTLSIRGNLVVNSTRDTRTLLTAGVLRIGGNVQASNPNSFAPTAAHETILDGGSTQLITVDSAAFDEGTWPHVRVRAPIVVFHPRNRESTLLTLTDFSFGTGSVELYGRSPTDCDCSARSYRIVPAGGAMTVQKSLHLGAMTTLTVAGTVRLAAASGDNVPAISGSGQIGVSEGTLQMGAGSVLGASFVMRGGNRLVAESGTQVIAGNVTLVDSSAIVMQDAADTLDIRGNLTINSTRDTRTLLTAGVLRVGGNFQASNLYSFAPTGSHETIFDGAGTQVVAVDSVALDNATWPHIRVEAPTVRFHPRNRENTSVIFTDFRIGTTSVELYGSSPTDCDCSVRRYRIAPSAGTMTVQRRLWLASTTTATIAGNLELPAASGDNVPTIDGSGSIGVTEGTFHMGTGSVLAATFVMRGTDQLVVHSGTQVIAGSVTLNDASAIVMEDAADTLSIRGNLIINSTRDTRTLLTAGVLRVGGNFQASNLYSFAPTASHETIFDGAGTQVVAVDSVALDNATWPHIRVEAPTVRFHPRNRENTSVVFTDFRIGTTSVELYGSSPTDCECSVRRYRIAPSAGTMAVQRRLWLASTTTATIAGNLELPAASGDNVPTVDGSGSIGVTEGTVRMGTGSLLSAPFVMRGGNRLVVEAGTQVIAAAVTLADSSAIVMQDPGDTLSIRGNLTINSTRDTRTLLTAGVLRVGGNFEASNVHSFAPTAPHKTILDGTGTQIVAVDSVVFDDGVWPNVRTEASTVRFHPRNRESTILALTNFQGGAANLEFYGHAPTDCSCSNRRWVIVPPAGPLLTAGSLRVNDGTSVTVDGDLTLSGVTNALSGSLTVEGNLAVTGASVSGSGTLRLKGNLVADTSSVVGLSLELFGFNQQIAPSPNYGSLLVTGSAHFNGTYVFSGSGNVASTGVMNVTPGSLVQFGRLSGANFTMQGGSQLDNQGDVRFTGSFSNNGVVVGNPPVSAAAAAVVVLTPPATNGSIETAVQTMPVVRVVDALGRVLVNHTVTFSVTRGFSQLTGASVPTNAMGIAALGGWTLGPTPTENRLSISVSGGTSNTVAVDARWDRRLSVSHGSACAIAATNAIHCWGDARRWQFGADPSSFGSDTAYITPTLTALGPYQRISEGFGEHMCGITAANAAQCWGRGGSGELGNGTAGDAGNAPVTPSGGISWRQISTGRQVTCGVSTTSVAYCWGLNQNGVLGDPGQALGATVMTPNGVAGGISFRSVSVGWKHACGIAVDSTAYCWGSNSSGQLGINSGNTGDFRSPNQVAAPKKLVQIAVGALYTCAVSIDQDLYCWGENQHGQLGDGTATDRIVPTAVHGGLRFTQVATGSWFSQPVPSGVTAPAAPGLAATTCAIQEDGKPYCWGWNAAGQIGDGTNIQRHAPTAVGGSLRLTGLGLGEQTSCGVRGTSVWCWGAGNLGQLGIGLTNNINFPQRVSSPF